MHIKPHKHKLAKWLGSIFLAIVLIVGAAAIYFNAKWKPLVASKIKEAVYEGSDHLYSINFQDIRLNLITGTVVLDSISLYPDSAVFIQLKAAKRAPAHLFRIKLAQLRLNGVGILTSYFKREINVKSIVLNQPSIDMVYHKVPKRAKPKDERTLYQQISASLKAIKVADIKVLDANFDYYNGQKKLNAIKHLSINIKDVLIDSLSQYDTTRVMYAKDMAFNLSNYSSVTADKMYTIKVDTVKGSMNRKTLVVKGLKLIPMYPDLTFSRKYTTQKDRYDISFNEINVDGIDFISLNLEGNIHAKKIAIGPGKVAIFMNRELPPPNFDKARNYPHNALKRLQIETLVDTLALKNVAIAYTEFNPKTKERGTVNLANLSGNILNVTNDSLRLTTKNHAYASLSTAIMGKGKMHVNIDFNLTNPAAPFTYEGSIGAFDMKVLNPLSKSLGLVEIESGQVQKVNFKVNATEKSASGTVKFYYSNLKVKLLGEDENGKKKEKGLLSFLANTVLIKNDNPTKGDEPRVAKVSFQREPQASFFNLMWKTVFVGIRETVGIGMVPMKDMPEPKKSKKEERQKRRAERKAAREKS